MLPIARTSETTNRKAICPAQGQRRAVHSGRENMDNSHSSEFLTCRIGSSKSKRREVRRPNHGPKTLATDGFKWGVFFGRAVGWYGMTVPSGNGEVEQVVEPQLYLLLLRRR